MWLLASGITDGDGNHLDGNGDGIPDDDCVLVNLMVAIPGDTDLDGDVDWFDYLTLMGSFGETGDWADGDFDHDGTVGLSDLMTLMCSYGFSINN